MYIEIFSRLSVSMVLAKNFIGGTGTSVNKWLFCEGVVDNIVNPSSHPAGVQTQWLLALNWVAWYSIVDRV